MTKPAAVWEPRFHLHVWRLCHEAALWRWERKMRKEENIKEETKYCRPVWAVDFTCCARNKEFFVPSEVVCCEDFPEKPFSSLYQRLLTFRRHDQTVYWCIQPFYAVPSQRQASILSSISLSNGGAKKTIPAKFSSIKCVQFLGLQNGKKKKKNTSGSKTRSSQILFVLCTSKIGSAITQLRTGTEWGGCEITPLLSSHSQWWQSHNNTDL